MKRLKIWKNKIETQWESPSFEANDCFYYWKKTEFEKIVIV